MSFIILSFLHFRFQLHLRIIIKMYIAAERMYGFEAVKAPLRLNLDKLLINYYMRTVPGKFTIFPVPMGV